MWTKETRIEAMCIAYDATARKLEELEDSIDKFQHFLDYLNTNFITMKEHVSVMRTFSNDVGEQLAELFPEKDSE